MAEVPAAITKQLKVLRESLWISFDDVIYYDVDGENYPRRIDLSKATGDELKELAAGCQKATFGVDQPDTLDETYRKAGKLDLDRFATRLDVFASGLLEAITPDILQGQAFDAEKYVRADIYKLNVYGPGSFFKAHRDTPRGEDMIGSLVVVFPTDHAGGELTLEHAGTTWTFDSAAQLSATPDPAVAYVAFYSDVTHAVEPVRTGYRVTLTYNLFLADRGTGTAPPQRAAPPPEQAFESALRTLLEDPAFLPTGGFVGYGLAHEYPMPRAGDGRGPLGGVLRILKGGDARIRTVSERIGLATSVKILYDSGQGSDYAGEDVIADEVLDTEHTIRRKGVLLRRDAERAKEVAEDKDYDMDSDREPTASSTAVPVHWVTKITKLDRVGSSYVAYGNEPSIAHAYGNAALFVRVPAFGEGVRAPIQREKSKPAPKARAAKSKKVREEEVIDVDSAPRRSTRSTRTRT
ncbi:hypothetical protein DFH06DRAFT_1327061 [Mycena polygramma]|nr:hypothetical protein DFH06DRAFT_1327061 [Mycena polygramma]